MTPNLLGRIIQIIENNGAASYNTYYQYNAANDLEHIIDNDNNNTSITYDEIGRKVWRY